MFIQRYKVAQRNDSYPAPRQGEIILNARFDEFLLSRTEKNNYTVLSSPSVIIFA